MMTIRTLKRRHWILIGLLVGAAVALIQLSAGPIGQAPVGMGQADFERLLQAPPVLGKYAALDEINIVPVGDVYWVRGQRRYPLADNSGFEYRTEWLALRERQYRPIDPALHPREAGQGGEYTVRTFLADAAARDPRVRYRYAWEKDARIVWPACLLGGALIGAMWAGLLRLLIVVPSGDGLNYALPQVASHAADAAPPPTEAEQRYLIALEAEMEAKLRAGATAPPPSQAKPHAPSAVKLDGVPLAPVATKSEDPKRYNGEFYPTETHVKREPG
jgi:hypothetical protein